MTKKPFSGIAKPPRLVMRFLAWFCPSELYEGIEGDLLEQFEADLQDETSSLSSKAIVRRARIRLLLNVLRFFRPEIIVRNKFSLRINYYMITNYFKVAFRVMSRTRVFSAINVIGLSLGITGALLLSLWIQHEFSYDDFHADRERIFKAWNRANNKDNINCWDITPRILAPTIQEQYAVVENAISYADWDDQLLFTVGEKQILKSSGVYTDPGFLTMFSFPLLKGNLNEALKEPASIVLTESFAKELFGNEDPFGEMLNIGSSGETFPLKITGILKDLPNNTEFQFDYLIPFQFVEQLQGGIDKNWGNNSVHSFIKIKKDADINLLNSQIKDLVKKNLIDVEHIELFLYPLSKMRLYSRFENGVPAGGRIEIIRMLAILGICLVAMACINFVNLSTARAQTRSKEIAVRKVAGAYKDSLITQFLVESIVIAFLAGMFSLVVVKISLPLFNDLIRQQLIIDWQNPQFWFVFLLFIVLVGMLAGGYPALYLAGFRPIKILKGVSISSSQGSTLRSVLVVFQFGFAVILIVSAIVINKQISFVQNREAGYDKENLVFQFMTGSLGKNFTAYKNELLQSNLATSVTRTSSPITDRWSNTTGIEWSGKDPETRIMFERFYQDENLSSTVGLHFVDGRDMNLSVFPSDSTAVIINETAARAMGFTTSPIGEIIRDNNLDWHIIGVVKDFVFTSPFQKVEPIIFFGAQGNWAFNVVHIRLNPSISSQESIKRLQEISKKYNPEYPFEYQFVDQAYAHKFAGIEATRKITNLFTTISIFIAGLGLLGLSTFMIEVRVKEIGIRKIMGGSVWSITRMLMLNSLKPILIAVVLFMPFAWYAMNWWLNSFAYRIAIDLWIMMFAATTVVCLALSIISIQTVRAANTNPVKTLRNE